MRFGQRWLENEMRSGTVVFHKNRIMLVDGPFRKPALNVPSLYEYKSGL